ncbi:MAG: hypothetical protein WC710_08145 [Gallionella sp.]|jgi:hypothetical protein
MIKLLRLEAVNLRYSIDDTEDLSTRRGGGYMLLQAVRDVQAKFKNRLDPISTGASIGLFEVKDSSMNLEQEVNNYLLKEYPHATFVVNMAEHDDFKHAVEASVAKNRWQQMQTLSFSSCWGQSDKVCGTDEFRPATSKDEHKGTPISLSVAMRRKDGRDLRQSFYHTELGTSDSVNLPEFTDETETLSKFGNRQEFSAIPPNLNGKMAVFYADGNSFGLHQRGCADVPALVKWDTDLKGKRRKLLKDLLDWLDTQPLARNADGKLRFETLLWGGDEMRFLLPAWLGLAFVKKFFELTRDWTYNDEKLTHATGLVFAKHSAPISQLQSLVDKLADHGKESDKSQNTLSWIVLETFDHAGDNMKDFWQRNGIQADGWKKLLLNEEKITLLLDSIAPVKAKLPRSAMVRVLRSMAANKVADEFSLLRRGYQSTDAAMEPQERENFAVLWKSLCDMEWDSSPEMIPAEHAIAWTIIIELWDYLLPATAVQILKKEVTQ